MNNRKLTPIRQRINISLPQETVDLIGRVVAKGNRSNLLDIAVKDYIQRAGHTNLRKRLEEGAINRAERDLHIAEEWFPIDEEAWALSQK